MVSSKLPRPWPEGVQMYGAFDVGVLVRGSQSNNQGVDDGTQYQVASGMNGHNGIGFRMSEDLGNGMKISGDAMFGFALDTGANAAGLGSNNGNGTLSTIYSYLALSGDFGTVIAGRAGGARAGFIKQYDPFGGFGVGGALQVQNSVRGNADYADNVIAWITPEVMPGLKFLAAYTTNLVGQDITPRTGGCAAGGLAAATGGALPSCTAVATPLYAVAGLYNSGPVSLTVAYENLSLDGLAALAPIKANEHSNVWTTGGSYDFGVAKVMALWTQVEHYQHGWQLGATAPLSEATTLKVGYATAKNNLTNAPGSADECSKYAVGVNHDLSKRTRLYADVARLADENGCTTGINTNGGTYSQSGNILGNALDGRDNGVGYGRWGMNVGVRHSF